MAHFTNYTVDGKDYLVLQIERDEQTGEALLYQQLQERMEKIERNVKKCGSLEKLEEMGGNSTKKFLVNTINLLKEFLLTYQVEMLLTTREDVEEAATNIKKCDISALLNNSWDNILLLAEDMRNSLIDNIFARQYNTPVCLAA